MYRPIRFKAGKRCDTVRFRADRVHTDMLRKSREIDRVHNHWTTDNANPGPVTRVLMGYGRCEGLVVGAHGECSPDVHSLIQRMTHRGALRRYKQMGFKSARNAKSTVLAQVRMALGVEAIRGVARVRLQNLGTALAGYEAAKCQANRRANAKARFAEQSNAHYARAAFAEPK